MLVERPLPFCQLRELGNGGHQVLRRLLHHVVWILICIEICTSLGVDVLDGLHGLTSEHQHGKRLPKQRSCSRTCTSGESRLELLPLS